MAQRVLITAGASGIGKEVAKTFAANGAKVSVCDIDQKGHAISGQVLPIDNDAQTSA